jgi:flagellar biosynthesis protein FliQ
MGVDQVVFLGRAVLTETMLLSAPILGVAILVSLGVNIVQVLTSLQDTTISTVARLVATGSVAFFTLPWMWRHLDQFTISMISDFHIYLQ